MVGDLKPFDNSEVPKRLKYQKSKYQLYAKLVQL